MKTTSQPKEKQRARVHGSGVKMSSPGRRKVLAARRARGGVKLSA